jgi:hypothetical protein
MSSRKIKVESMTNLTTNSLVRLATVVYDLILYILIKNLSHEELWYGKEGKNCDGNDPVVRNDYLVKWGEEGETDAARCF